MLLSDASTDGVCVQVSPDGMLLWVFCGYSSNFTDLQRHRECYVDDEGCLQFQEIAILPLCKYYHVCQGLWQDLVGGRWRLTFLFKVDLYDEEDITRPQDFFSCTKSC